MHRTHTFASGAGTEGWIGGISKASKRQVRQIGEMVALLWSTVPYHPLLDRTRPDLACFCAPPVMIGGCWANPESHPKQEGRTNRVEREKDLGDRIWEQEACWGPFY